MLVRQKKQGSKSHQLSDDGMSGAGTATGTVADPPASDSYRGQDNENPHQLLNANQLRSDQAYAESLDRASSQQANNGQANLEMARIDSGDLNKSEFI